MKGYIFIKAKPQKDSCTIRRIVALRQISRLDEALLLRSFLNGLKMSTEEARIHLDAIDLGIFDKKEEHYEGTE